MNKEINDGHNGDIDDDDNKKDSCNETTTTTAQTTMTMTTTMMMTTAKTIKRSNCRERERKLKQLDIS